MLVQSLLARAEKISLGHSGLKNQQYYKYRAQSRILFQHNSTILAGASASRHHLF